MFCEGKNCICEPVRLLEGKRGGADNHEVVYAEACSDSQASERSLSAGEADAVLQQRLQRRPQKFRKNRCVNFQQAHRGETDSEKSGDENSHVRMKAQQQAAKKHRKNKRQAATTRTVGQLSDGITADAEDNDNVPVVRRVSRGSKTLATQTGDSEHQRSDQQEREAFARAVQLGTLWTRDELIQAQLADVDLQPVYTAK